MVRVGLIGNQHGLARSLGEAGLDLVVHPAATANRNGLDHPRVQPVEEYAALSGALEHPRLILLDLPVGPTIDAAVDAAYLTMEPGDVVLDASGSYWGDTLRRFRRMRHRSLFYVDLALIGPIPEGLVLAAGDKRGVDLAWPLLTRLAPSGGVVRAGGAGAAHYALMVREAVAAATAQAIGEAQQLLEAYPNQPEPEPIMAGLWPGTTDGGSRAAWLLDDAARLEAPIPLLAQAIMLEIGRALDDQRSAEPAPRVGGFVHPEEIL